MAALTKDRNTTARLGDLYAFPAAANAVVHIGALVVLSATGFAQPGAAATGLTAVGRAEDRVDNTGGADGDLTVKVRSGVFHYANDSGDAVDLTAVGSLCYIVDDQTVAASDGAGTRSAAGTVRDVDAQGVWVEIG